MYSYYREETCTSSYLILEDEMHSYHRKDSDIQLTQDTLQFHTSDRAGQCDGLAMSDGDSS